MKEKNEDKQWKETKEEKLFGCEAGQDESVSEGCHDTGPTPHTALCLNPWSQMCPGSQTEKNPIAKWVAFTN